MVEFRVDRGSGVPAYLQLAQQVREALRLGWLTPGDRLPTVREVVATSGVNPNTVLKAYRELEFAGLVEARQGAGTFVKAGLGTGDREALGRLYGELVEWLASARAAGLENEDVYALLRTALEGEKVND
ncbi:GntR family transcriptional regulator [Kutzneria sp. CA-103260]|uniref:GntR family transcriptional regulator n=1 Tax=Kutzneria sp. CA-103260 TaxID=2802641 RepID=UPI001BAA823E|nr:GntR family transcriptional regulator [Kutzneria sp. CA-103260]QUQ70909.1 GntR family transcriptional regulator [Kutzneria sp. CA-103260]